jgi:hypothetical protein
LFFYYDREEKTKCKGEEMRNLQGQNHNPQKSCLEDLYYILYYRDMDVAS